MSSPSSTSSDNRESITMARVAWLQSLTSYRIVTVSFAKALYEHCCAVTHAPYTKGGYESMLQDTTKHLSLLDLELRRFKDQTTGKSMLALVNAKADKMVQGATRYSAQEISFLKKLIEEIFKARKEAFSLPSLEAVRLGSKLRNTLTRDATETLLKNLVDHQWIEYSVEGIYTLSTRSLLELRNYLQNEFGEEHFHTCTHCKDMITVGLGCSHSPRSCQSRYHMHCARVVIGSAVDSEASLAARSGFPCPECRRPWKSRPIGPKVWQDLLANPSTSEDESQSSKRSMDLPRDLNDNDSDQAGSDQLNEEEILSQPRRRPSVSSRSIKPERGGVHDNEEGGQGQDFEDVKPQRIFD